MAGVAAAVRSVRRGCEREQVAEAMTNPFQYGSVVAGDAFCNRRSGTARSAAGRGERREVVCVFGTPAGKNVAGSDRPGQPPAETVCRGLRGPVADGFGGVLRRRHRRGDFSGRRFDVLQDARKRPSTCSRGWSPASPLMTKANRASASVRRRPGRRNWNWRRSCRRRPPSPRGRNAAWRWSLTKFNGSWTTRATWWNGNCGASFNTRRTSAICSWAAGSTWSSRCFWTSRARCTARQATTRFVPIAEEHWIDFIRQRFLDAGKRIDDDTIRTVCRLTQGHPFYTQHLCHVLWERTEPKAAVTEDSIRAAVRVAPGTGELCLHDAVGVVDRAPTPFSRRAGPGAGGGQAVLVGVHSAVRTAFGVQRPTGLAVAGGKGRHRSRERLVRDRRSFPAAVDPPSAGRS